MEICWIAWILVSLKDPTIGITLDPRKKTCVSIEYFSFSECIFDNQWNYVRMKGSSSPTEVPSKGTPITGPGTPYSKTK